MSRSRVLNLANYQQFQAINVLSDPGAIGGPVVIENAIRVCLVFGLANSKSGRVFIGGTVSGSFAPTVALAEQLRAAFVTGAAWSSVAAHLAPTCSLQAVELYDLRPGMSRLPVRSTGASTPGTSTGTALPSETAIAYTVRTATAGPRGRGRLYIPGWATTAIAAGDVIAPAVITALNNWTNTINTALGTAGIVWSVLNAARAAYTGSTGTQHPARAATTLPMTSVLVRNNTWDSQRRRGLK